MNYPLHNLLQLKSLAEMASTNLIDVPYTKNAARQALKMKAALEMVLMFHSGEPWKPGCAWTNLQVDAGVEMPREAATTRVLCDTIREVLGMQEEKQERRLA